MPSYFLADFFPPSNSYMDISPIVKGALRRLQDMFSKIIHYLLLHSVEIFSCFFSAEFVKFSACSKKVNSYVFIIDITLGPLNHVTE